MLKKTLLASCAIALLMSCGPKNEAIIELEITNGERVALMLADTAQAAGIDTLDLPTSGKMTYTLQLTEPNFYILDFLKGKSVPLYLEPGDKIKVVVDVTGEMLSDRISGSEGLDILQNINAEFAKSLAVVDSLELIMEAAYEQGEAGFLAVRDQLDVVYAEQIKKHRAGLEQILEQHKGHLSTIFVFYQRLGNTPIFNPYENIEPFLQAEKDILEKYPNNPHALFFANRNKRFKEAIELDKKRKEVAATIVEGNPAPEIALAKDNGDILKLSSFKGQVVLLDFWAAWCGPCRQANPRVVSVYNQFKDKGFTVYSVSLDGLPQQPAPREEWLKAIQEDQLTWDNHVSELNGWNSSIVNTYGIEGIPFTLLLDKEGIIRKVNPQPEQLPELLKELL